MTKLLFICLFIAAGSSERFLDQSSSSTTEWDKAYTQKRYFAATEVTRTQKAKTLPSPTLRKLTEGQTQEFNYLSDTAGLKDPNGLWLTLHDEFNDKFKIAVKNYFNFSGPTTLLDKDFDDEMLKRLVFKTGMYFSDSKDLRARHIYVGQVKLIQSKPQGNSNEMTKGIFRPCLADWKFSTTQCSYKKPADSYGWAKNWAKNAWVKSDKGYPWTGEGWTYDWLKDYSVGSSNNYGLQEFVAIDMAKEIYWVQEKTEKKAKGFTPTEYLCEVLLGTYLVEQTWPNPPDKARTYCGTHKKLVLV